MTLRLSDLQITSQAFKDALFWKALWKTILWVVFGVGFQFVFGFILALLLNKKFRGRGVVRAVSLIPWVTPGILIGLMWRWMYDGNYGVLNDILQKLHIINKSIPFLAQTNTAFPAVVVTIIWQGIPFFALMILADCREFQENFMKQPTWMARQDSRSYLRLQFQVLRIQSLSQDLSELSRVANSVDVIFNMTEGGPAYATQTLSVYVFNKAQALNLGYSSAMAILLALVLCLVAVPYLIFTFREEDK